MESVDIQSFHRSASAFDSCWHWLGLGEGVSWSWAGTNTCKDNGDTRRMPGQGDTRACQARYRRSLKAALGLHDAGAYQSPLFNKTMTTLNSFQQGRRNVVNFDWRPSLSLFLIFKRPCSGIYWMWLLLLMAMVKLMNVLSNPPLLLLSDCPTT